MISVGVDVGSTTIKVVIVEDGVVRRRRIVPSGNLPARTAAETLDAVLAEDGRSRADADVIATTGYGRRLVDFGDTVMTEIKACALGVRHATPPDAGVRTILDVGGQDTKVIALADDGEVEDFGMNDKCAAGTGRFLEMLAHKLELPYETFVEDALASETPLQMNSTCAVFAESEVVGLLARGEAKGDIAAAAHDAIAGRVSSMLRRVGRRPAYCFVGGGAHNRAVVKAIEEHLGEPVLIPEDAQAVVALGAAVGAADRLRRQQARDTDA